MTTSKNSICFDNKHIQSIVIEGGYFKINLLATSRQMLIIFKCEAMSLSQILELISV